MKKECFDSCYSLANTSETIIINDAERKLISEDNTLSKFIAMYSLIGVINLLIKIIIPMSDVTWRTLSYVFMAVLIVLLLKPIVIVIRRKLFEFVITELIFMVIYSASMLMNNADRTLLLNGAFNTLCICIPMMMCVYAVKDKSILYNNLLKYSYVIIAASSLSLIVLGGKMSYSMALSSYINVFAMLQWNETLRNKKMKNYIFALYSFIFILVFGNRGALLCLCTFIGIKILHKNRGSIRKLLFAIFMTFIVFFVFIYFNEILSVIDIMLKNHGINSYTLTQLVNKEFFTSNSRIELFFYYFNLIKQRPLLGWGVWGGYIDEGLGPHNIVLEFLLAFGVGFGAIFAILFIASMIRIMFFGRRTEYLYDLSLIYCSANITMLLSAGDFLKKPDLFIFIALCFAMPIMRKSKNI